MARSDNTTPWRLRPAHELVGYVRRYTSSEEIGLRSREHNRRDRHDARADLHRHVEPEPRQTRSRALWDAF